METIDSAVIGCGRMGAFTSEIVTRYCPPCWMPLSHIQALLASDEISLVVSPKQMICSHAGVVLRSLNESQ